VSDVPRGYGWLHDLVKQLFPDVSIEHTWVSGEATTKLVRGKHVVSFTYPIEGDDRLAIGDGAVTDFVIRAREGLADGGHD